MISDKAVEAAARATCQVSWEMLDPMQRAAILADTRNLLQAALPVLLEGLEPVAWRSRHVPYVSWSYSREKPLRTDLEIEPIYSASSITGESE